MSETKELMPAFKEKNVLCFAVDNDYVKYLSVALLSFYYHADENKNYTIVILNKDITKENKEKLLYEAKNNFSLIFYDIAPIQKQFVAQGKFKPKAHWSESIYYRLLIPFIFKNYNKVLYLDSDIIFNGNIDELFNINSDSKKLFAALDSISPEIKFDKHKKRKNYMKNCLELKDPSKYFNSGVLLFDIKNINNDEYLKNLKTALDKFENLMYPDQDLLNAIFIDEVEHISLSYNFQTAIPIYQYECLNLYDEAYLKDYSFALKNPKIIHYTGGVKPWHNPKLLFYEKFWQFARKSTFYEEMIFNNFDENFKLMISKDEVFKKYRISKILSNITFGKTKEKYEGQKNKLKKEVTKIRHIIEKIVKK